MTRWSEKQFEEWQNNKRTEKRNKYNAKRTEVDGVVFDSKKESDRYRELKLLEHANKIYNLKLQPRFELQEGYEINGRSVRKIEYVADFSYRDADTRELIVEDVKSPATKTAVYKLKKKLFEKKFEVEIREI